MNTIRDHEVAMSRLGRTVMAVLTAAVLLGACGSNRTDKADTATAAKTSAKSAPAAAKENASTEPVCHDLYRPTVQVGCAENTIGPGGGVIFYDAHSVQPWGRFLEVAPQKWNGPLYGCPGNSFLGSTCGAAAGVEKKTADFYYDTRDYSWTPCSKTSDWYAKSMDSSVTVEPFDQSLKNLPTAIGTGRANSAAVLAVPGCTAPNPRGTGAYWSSFQMAAKYRGGGLDDWFIPSLDELRALCRFGNRDAIGGFSTGSDAGGDWRYMGSSTFDMFNDGRLTWSSLSFGGSCSVSPWYVSFRVWDHILVRPIRAF